MTLKQRREREKQAMRDGILAAARHIARQQGWSAVTIRKIAEHIEYSPPMVYEYFANKEDLLQELVREGFHLLTTSMQRACYATDGEALSPEAQLNKIGDAYCQFARVYPELYQLMHGLGVALDSQERVQAAQVSCKIVLDTLMRWAQSKNVTLKNPEEAVEALWALLHGLVTLFIVDSSQKEDDRAERLAKQTLQSLLQAWSSSA
ncbi:TetR family transcriptional regulator [Thermosporothrix hazakensis]|jgi:AcrR family transcriptional regulator|uniref:TetR family transcriptional regulator n=2 Tax=Thermosporothrix TaxID=768650 RepID=A0A326U1Y2_THEHA|nr:TetR/AcrR family transcriptional regulator [Thermosporothrix hazakensis]PZW24106.1 TetR family transcriptional regulator [Thermosporothrix hazakensis]BBH87894.1 TetR family transcriptional regulator [Thermosporothrix sp. COM3]GCE50318.1 TetR family transcriptional regulator [Thermosporothrix hazakensis]